MGTVAKIKAIPAVSIYLTYLAKPVFNNFRINIGKHPCIIIEAVKRPPGIFGMFDIDSGTQTIGAISPVIIQCYPKMDFDAMSAGCGDSGFRRVEPAEKFHSFATILIADKIKPVRSFRMIKKFSAAGKSP